jgi:hypothetical protein
VTEAASSTSLDDLRDTVKWLIASAAGVTAALVATFQFKGLGQLAKAGVGRQAAAAAAAFVALTVILLVVVRGAQVLATPRLSLRDLADREFTAGGVKPKLRLEPLPDRLVQDILEQRSDLLDGNETISDFYAQYRASMSTRDAVMAGQQAELAGRKFDGKVAADVEAVNNLAALNEQKVERLETRAQFLAAQRRFARLTRGFPIGAFLFAVAIVALAWLTAPPASAAQISKPTGVLVYLKTNPATYGFPGSCHTRELSGVAVGGTFDHPIVITDKTAGCPARILNSSDLVAVPSLPSSQPTPVDRDYNGMRRQHRYGNGRADCDHISRCDDDRQWPPHSSCRTVYRQPRDP